MIKEPQDQSSGKNLSKVIALAEQAATYPSYDRAPIIPHEVMAWLEKIQPEVTPHPDWDLPVLMHAQGRRSVVLEVRSAFNKQNEPIRIASVDEGSSDIDSPKYAGNRIDALMKGQDPNEANQ